MGKKKCIALISGICLAVFLAGTMGPPNASAADPPKSISLASAGEGTSQFAVHAGMTTLLTKYMGIKAVPEASSVGGKTLHLLHNGEVELASSTDHAAYDAARGFDQFEKSGRLTFRLVSGGAVFHLAMSAVRDSGVRSLQDLKGKKVQATHPGNITFTKGMDLFLDAEGMGRSDITDLKFYGSRDIAPALKEGRAAASMTGLSVRAVPGWLQNLNLETPVILFAPAKEKIDAVLPKYPYFVEGAVAGRVYGNIVDEKDLPTIGAGMSLYCRADLPEEFVYEMMKAIFDHGDELQAFHKGAVEWTENPLRRAVVPFHPGAIRYYKEKGLWKPEHENVQQKLLAELGAAK